MPKYSVALFLEKTVFELGNSVQKQRLQQHVVMAKNEAEALGLVIRDTKRPNQDYPVIYHSVVRT